MSAVIPSDPDRKRAVRRTAVWLALIAAGVYFAFIIAAVVRGS